MIPHGVVIPRGVQYGGELARGIRATPVAFPQRRRIKPRAVRCYASQLSAFGARAIAATTLPESCWRLDDA